MSLMLGRLGILMVKTTLYIHGFFLLQFILFHFISFVSYFILFYCIVLHLYRLYCIESYCHCISNNEVRRYSQAKFVAPNSRLALFNQYRKLITSREGSEIEFL